MRRVFKRRLAHAEISAVTILWVERQRCTIAIAARWANVTNSLGVFASNRDGPHARNWRCNAVCQRRMKMGPIPIDPT